MHMFLEKTPECYYNSKKVMIFLNCSFRNFPLTYIEKINNDMKFYKINVTNFL